MTKLTKAQKQLLTDLYKITMDGENDKSVALTCSIEIDPWEMTVAKNLEKKGMIELDRTDASLTEKGFSEAWGISVKSFMRTHREFAHETGDRDS